MGLDGKSILARWWDFPLGPGHSQQQRDPNSDGHFGKPMKCDHPCSEQSILHSRPRSMYFRLRTLRLLRGQVAFRSRGRITALPRKWTRTLPPSPVGGSVGDHSAGREFQEGGDMAGSGYTDAALGGSKRQRTSVAPLSRFLVAGFVGLYGGRIRVGGQARIRPRSQGITPGAGRCRR